MRGQRFDGVCPKAASPTKSGHTRSTGLPQPSARIRLSAHRPTGSCFIHPGRLDGLRANLPDTMGDDEPSPIVLIIYWDPSQSLIQEGANAPGPCG
jgi:hypothetical protein